MSPKSLNLKEYSLLLHSYKALFSITQGSMSADQNQQIIKDALKEVELANRDRKQVQSDPVKFKNNLIKMAAAQYRCMVSQAKAYICMHNLFIDRGVSLQQSNPQNEHKIKRVIANLHKTDNSLHPSCYSAQKQQENDFLYRNCQHSHP